MTKRVPIINPQNYNFNQFYTRKILMLFKRYESSEVDRRTWLHVSSGTHWSTSSKTHQVVEIQILINIYFAFLKPVLFSNT